jgi:hypothetical protein
MTPERKRYAIVFVVALAGFLGGAGPRLRAPSTDTHFVYLARSLLSGRVAMIEKPPNDNDWAKVETLALADGRTLRGAFLVGEPNTFRTTRGQRVVVPAADIKSRTQQWYVSFPPLPAIAMMPLVAIWDHKTNDVVFNALWSAMNVPLLLWLLGRLRRFGLSERSHADDLWLCGMFAFGTVYFYSSCIGQVWYTAHVMGVTFATLFVGGSLEARHPALAGLMLGLATATRTPMLFLAPFFLFELWRIRQRGARLSELVLPVLKFCAGAGVIGAGLAWFNWVRFDRIGEFGHTYLAVRWAGRIQRYGLFNYNFLSRNLAAMLVLTPKLLSSPPYVQISWHGMSVLLTTPALAYLLWPYRKGPLHRALWLTVGLVAAQTLFYQNDGWVQFGYRFLNDYIILLMALLAVGGRPITRTWKVLILAGVCVNLFGAITFGRAWGYYYDGFFPAE